MKKLLVFGASGGTGKALVHQALNESYEVTIVLRNPDAFKIKHQNLKNIKGDVLLISSFQNELNGKDTVISCLGTGTNLKPTKVYSQGIENILQAMSIANVERLLCISAGGVEATNEMGFFIRLLTKQVLQKILENVYEDMRIMERILVSSKVKYTIMRPARLTNKLYTGKYRTAINSHIERPWSIAKVDLAHFMLNAIDNPQTFKNIIEIAY